jgi:hypothetical protein
VQCDWHRGAACRCREGFGAPVVVQHEHGQPAGVGVAFELRLKCVWAADLSRKHHSTSNADINERAVDYLRFSRSIIVDATLQCSRALMFGPSRKREQAADTLLRRQQAALKVRHVATVVD